MIIINYCGFFGRDNFSTDTSGFTCIWSKTEKDSKIAEPSHEEIMTKWWLIDGVWQKITGYTGKWYVASKDNTCFDRRAFTNFKSADIPSEVK